MRMSCCDAGGEGKEESARAAKEARDGVFDTLRELTYAANRSLEGLQALAYAAGAVGVASEEAVGQLAPSAVTESECSVGGASGEQEEGAEDGDDQGVVSQGTASPTSSPAASTANAEGKSETGEGAAPVLVSALRGGPPGRSGGGSKGRRRRQQKEVARGVAAGERTAALAIIPEEVVETTEEAVRGPLKCDRVKLRFVDGEDRKFGLSFSTAPTTPLAKYLAKFCNHLGLQASQVRFWSGRCGRSIRPGTTAGGLGLIDGDRIFAEDKADGDAVRRASAARRSLQGV